MPDRIGVVVSVPGLLADDLLPLADSPALESLRLMIESGVLGLVGASPSANVTQQLWTLATGQPPSIHGVPGPFAAMPLRTGLYPIGRRNSRNRPFWELSAIQGLKSCCLAWPGTRDTSVRDLFVVTDDIHSATGSSREAWPLLPGCANGRETELLDLRVHPSEVSSGDIDFFVGRSDAPGLRAEIARAIAAAATVQALLLYALGAREWRLIAVHFDFLDRIRRLASRSGRMAGTMIARGYRFFDLLLRNLRRELSQNHVLIVVAPPARRGVQHVSGGALILEGSGIEQDVLVGDVELIDIAPTALHVVGADIPSALPGRPLSGAWKAFAPPRIRQSTQYSHGASDRWALSEVSRLGLHAARPLASVQRQVDEMLRSTTVLDDRSLHPDESTEP